MPLAANPFVNPAAYDYLWVAGVPNQGVFRLLDNDGRPYKWDVKDTAGAEGATITYRGWKLAEFKGRFEFWAAGQIEHFENVYVPLLRYDATKQNPQPVSVSHPVLSSRNVNSAVITSLGGLVDSGNQLWTVTVSFTEYRPPKKKNVTTTPNGSGKDTDKPAQKPSVEDRLDQSNARLAEQFKNALPVRRPRG